MTLRSVLSLISGRKRKRDSDEQNALKDQLNTLKLAKEKLLLNNSTNSNLLTQIDNTFLTLELDLKKYLDEKAKYLILRSGAKWYEEGERSNAYFLNIINKRNEQTQITKLESMENYKMYLLLFIPKTRHVIFFGVRYFKFKIVLQTSNN